MEFHIAIKDTWRKTCIEMDGLLNLVFGKNQVARWHYDILNHFLTFFVCPGFFPCGFVVTSSRIVDYISLPHWNWVYLCHWLWFVKSEQKWPCVSFRGDLRDIVSFFPSSYIQVIFCEMSKAQVASTSSAQPQNKHIWNRHEHNHTQRTHSLLCRATCLSPSD